MHNVEMPHGIFSLKSQPMVISLSDVQKYNVNSLWAPALLNQLPVTVNLYIDENMAFHYLKQRKQ